MTVFYPDISSFQAGVSLAGAPAVSIKVTEGTGYVNPDYGAALARAKTVGAFAFAYHFLHHGSAGAQATFCYSKAGKTPVMIDFEPTTGSDPQLPDAAVFCDTLRKLGGVCTLAYVPRWYWSQLGSPSLAPLASRGLAIVSSAYTAYTDNADGVGWLPYGGMTPKIWQYTDAHSFNGHSVDFNAYRGTVAQLEALIAGGHPVPPSPPGPNPAPAFPYPAADYLGTPRPDPHCHSGYYGGIDNINVHTWQAQMAHRGYPMVMDGDYGPHSEAVCRDFQMQRALSVDGLVGPHTWSTSWTAPEA